MGLISRVSSRTYRKIMEPGEILESKKVVNLDIPLSVHHSPIVDNFETRFLSSSNLGYNVHVISTYLPSNEPDKKIKNTEIYEVLDQLDNDLEINNENVQVGKKRKNKNKKNKNLQNKRPKIESQSNKTGPYFLKRITIELKNMDDQIKVQRHVQNKGYDIVAVLPRTEEMLKAACKQLDVDLIVLEQATPDDKKYLTPNR